MSANELPTREDVMLMQAKIADLEAGWSRCSQACAKLQTERDLYAAQAKINHQTVIRQAHEIRKLERDIARLTKPEEGEHEEFIGRFGL